MVINKLLAKPYSYGRARSLNDVEYIVIHYTGNKGDTAIANARYFATSNTRSAGAHLFVDKDGTVFQSVELNRVAWSVGGVYSTSNGAGSFYKKCTNSNSVSIELCDCLKDASWEQYKSTRELVKLIRRKCPNAKTILRHWDVNGKSCPSPMVGTNNRKWRLFKTYIDKGYQYEATVTKKVAVRTSPKIRTGNIYDYLEVGSNVKVTKITGKFARLSSKTEDGKYKYVVLSKLRESL